MDKCFIEQGSGLVVYASGNRLPAKSVLFCRMTPFIITEDGGIDNFTGGKVDIIYQADDQCFDFFKNRSKNYKLKKSEYNY